MLTNTDRFKGKLLLNLNSFCPGFCRADCVTLKGRTVLSVIQNQGCHIFGSKEGKCFLYCRSV